MNGLHKPPRLAFESAMEREMKSKLSANTENDCIDEEVLPAGRLERALLKKPAAWTVDDLIDVVKDRGIRVVSLMHVG